MQRPHNERFSSSEIFVPRNGNVSSDCSLAFGKRRGRMAPPPNDVTQC
jgi:hypothetical protein